MARETRPTKERLHYGAYEIIGLVGVLISFVMIGGVAWLVVRLMK